MKQLINRLKRAWELSKLDHTKVFTAESLEITPAMVEELKRGGVIKPVVEGDGKAEFIAPMTDSEYAQYVHEEDEGWKKFYEKLTGRTNAEQDRADLSV